uniref:hypothetical protein n=1 Tax=Mogibacterium timidum TaxID=35519 RepID=UPI0028D651E6
MLNAHVEMRSGVSRTVKNLKYVKTLCSDSENVITEYDSFIINADRYAFVGDNILTVFGPDI